MAYFVFSCAWIACYMHFTNHTASTAVWIIQNYMNVCPDTVCVVIIIILFYFLLLLKIGLRDDSFRNDCRNTALFSSNLSLLQPLLVTETKRISFYAATYDDNRCYMHFTNHTRHWQSIPDKYHCNQSINQSIKFLWCQFLYAYGISRWCTSCLELDQCP